MHRRPLSFYIYSVTTMRGLSPLVSTIILIVAAVIGGTLAYQYFVSTMSHLTSKTVVTIDQATLFDNRVLFISVSYYSKSAQIEIKGIQIICGDNIATITVDNPSLEVNGTTITYVSSTPICTSPQNLLVSVVYSTGSQTFKTEPVRPVIH